MPSRPHDTVDAGAPRRVGRPRGRTSQGAASRETIIEAAAGVFARLGYDRARMADIVEASGLSKGSVYFHFDSKEALAVAVLTARHERWIQGVRAHLDPLESGEARLRALLPAVLALHDDDPHAWVISRLSVALSEQVETRGIAAELSRRWVEVIAEVVRDAAADSEIDAVAAATVLVGGFDGLKATAHVQHPDDPAAAHRALTRAGALLNAAMITEILGR